MSAQTNRDSDYITKARAANRAAWNAINDLVELQKQWNSLDYGTTLPDGVGENEGITKTAVGAVVFDTTNALVALLNQGHGTNMAQLL